MRDLTMFERQAISLLTESGTMKGPDLAVRMGVQHKDVSRIVSSLRKKFVNGNQNAVYVHLSKSGYTLEETPENLKYEGRRRLKMGTSIILNGKHIFMRYKAISLNDYHQLKIAFQPKALNTINVLSDDTTPRRRNRVVALANNGHAV